MSILRNILNRLMLKADSTATTQTTAVIQATDTNSGIALVPNGTGAITADIPDGTAVGGDVRGTNAVDLQMSRTTSANVARGANTVIVGGYDNRTWDNYAVIVGGFTNSARGQSSSIVGGQNNSTIGLD